MRPTIKIEMAETSGKKKNTLTLKSKIDLLNIKEEQRLSVTELCRKFHCGKTQVYQILREKDTIKEEWINGERKGGSKRKLRKTGNETINRILYEWFLNAKSQNIPISGPILQEKAKMIAQCLKNDSFKASNGWLESFKTRHEIVFKHICGEAKDVNLAITGNWKQKLTALIKDYEPRNIAACGETGLFFRALPSKTVCLKKDKCVGGKQPKERLTVLLCGFADGTMEKPLVIAHTLKRRCFKNLNVHELPVMWRANKKVWMNSIIMDEWLNSLNRKIKTQKRHLLLFLENASCHNHLDLSNIKLCFLPPNTTSLLQILDQGIVRNFKVHYRKHMLQSIYDNMGECNSTTELSGKISVLDAVHWISDAQKNICPSYVRNCFRKASFVLEENDDTDEKPTLLKEMTDIQTLMRAINENYVTPQDYVNIDNDLLVLDDVTIDEPLDGSVDNDQESEIDDQDEEVSGLVMDIEENEKITCFADAFKKVTALEQYAQRIEYTPMLESLLQLRTVMEKKAPQFEKTRKTVKYYFNEVS